MSCPNQKIFSLQWHKTELTKPDNVCECGVFKLPVCLLWSESVNHFVNLVHFPLGSVSHIEKSKWTKRFHYKSCQNSPVCSLVKWIWGGNKTVNTGRRFSSVLVDVLMRVKLLYNINSCNNWHLLKTEWLSWQHTKQNSASKTTNTASHFVKKMFCQPDVYCCLGRLEVWSRSYKQMNHSRDCLGPDWHHIQ